MTKRTVKTWAPFTGAYFYGDQAIQARTRKEAAQKWAQQQRIVAGQQFSAAEADALVVFWVTDMKSNTRKVYTSYPPHRQ